MKKLSKKKVVLLVVGLVTLSVVAYLGYGYWYVHSYQPSCGSFSHITLNTHSFWHDFYGVEPPGQCNKNYDNFIGGTVEKSE